MVAPVKLNFKIYQGATFNEVLRWESSTKVYTPITNITQTAPMVVTAAGHGAVVGWRAKVTNVLGMKDANMSDYVVITGATSDEVTFNSINAVGYSAYTSGGILEYNQPNSLGAVTARMQIREKLSSTTVIKELTTENSGITIDDTLKTITVTISATDTAAFTFKTAVYSMELISGAVVTPFIYGDLVLVSEITR
jgi:hypothetical protein